MFKNGFSADKFTTFWWIPIQVHSSDYPEQPQKGTESFLSIQLTSDSKVKKSLKEQDRAKFLRRWSK